MSREKPEVAALRKKMRGEALTEGERGLRSLPHVAVEAILDERRRAEKAPTLYDWVCTVIAVTKDVDASLVMIRARLQAVAVVLATQRGENPANWSVYVERHIVGVRAIVRDAQGNEVDLQRLPAELMEEPE